MKKRAREGHPPSAWSAKQIARRHKTNKIARKSRKGNHLAT